MSWKDKRIKAINRLSKIKGWNTSSSNKYFDEVQEIYKTSANSLKEFKKVFYGTEKTKFNL